MLKKIIIFVVFISLVPITWLLWDLAKDRSLSIKIIKQSYLYKNWKPLTGQKSIASAEAGEKLKVLRVRYGKDYMSVKIEKENGLIGWLFYQSDRIQLNGNEEFKPRSITNKTNEQILKEAQEDFDDIVAGRPTRNTIPGHDTAYFTDGGTMVYSNYNYKITIQKKMTNENGTLGFFYGPIIVFNNIYENGKQKELKAIKFYRVEELNKLLGRSFEK